MSSAYTAPRPLNRFERFIAACRKPVYVIAAVSVLLTGCNTLGDTAAARWAEKQPRDENTGVMRGGETLTLGPEDAATAVLLVHGYVGGSNNFGELPRQLEAAGFHVRALRLPGHGTSPQDMALTPDEAYLNHVLREYRTLKKEHDKVILVGHSMGGTLSTLAAGIAEPDGLVLAAPYFGVSHKWYYVLTPETWSKLTRPFLKWTYKSDHFLRVNDRKAVHDIFSYRWIPAESNRALMRLGKYARDEETLGDIQCPVLWLHGRGDDAAAYERAEKAVAAMSSESKQHIELERSNHHVFWDFDKEEVVAAVVGFVREQSNGS